MRSNRIHSWRDTSADVTHLSLAHPWRLRSFPLEEGEEGVVEVGPPWEQQEQGKEEGEEEEAVEVERAMENSMEGGFLKDIWKPFSPSLYTCLKVE